MFECVFLRNKLVHAFENVSFGADTVDKVNVNAHEREKTCTMNS